MPDQIVPGVAIGAPAEPIGRIGERAVHRPAPPMRRGRDSRFVHGGERCRRQHAGRRAHLRQHPPRQIAHRRVHAAGGGNLVIIVVDAHRVPPQPVRPRPAFGMLQPGPPDARVLHPQRLEQPRTRGGGIILARRPLDDLRRGVIGDVLIGIAGARRAERRQRAQLAADRLGVRAGLQLVVPRIAHQPQPMRQQIGDGRLVGAARQRQRGVHGRQRGVERQPLLIGKPGDQRGGNRLRQRGPAEHRIRRHPLARSRQRLAIATDEAQPPPLDRSHRQPDRIGFLHHQPDPLVEPRIIDPRGIGGDLDRKAQFGADLIRGVFGLRPGDAQCHDKGDKQRDDGNSHPVSFGFRFFHCSVHQWSWLRPTHSRLRPFVAGFQPKSAAARRKAAGFTPVEHGVPGNNPSAAAIFC